jgi:CBS domain containing-hemolysin-like protein
MVIFLIILFLVLSAFFSGSEIAFVSANKLAVEVKKNKGSRRSRILTNFYKAPEKFLGTMLVGNNIALVVFTALMTSAIQPIFDPWIMHPFIQLFITTILITIVVLIFGEFLPKTLFSLYADELIYNLTFPLAFFKWILGVPAWMMTKLSAALLVYIMRVPWTNETSTFTRLDLESFIDDHVSEEQEKFDTDIFKNALNLRQIKVRDCMIPRNEIVSLDVTESLKELEKMIKESRHSRIVIIDGDIENVIGYVHHHSLLNETNDSIRKMVMHIPFVPEAMNSKDLLSQFIKESRTMACVVDEFGGTAGIITIEDILEEIFGEIVDEHDEEDYVEEKISEREYRFSGRLEIDYLNEKYEHINIPEGEYHTLSGYLVMTLGSIPDDGTKIELDGYTYELEIAGETKIDTVRIHIHEAIE